MSIKITLTNLFCAYGWHFVIELDKHGPVWRSVIVERPEIYRAFGKAIAGRRRALDKTQHQLALKARISRASLANIEGGRQHVYLHHVVALAQALEMQSLRELLPDALVNDGAAPMNIVTPDKLSAAQRRQIGEVFDDHMLARAS